VSRVITGKLQLSWEQVQMSEIVISAVNSIRPAAGAKNIVIKIDIAPGEHIISGDPNRLQQIAWNLLSNAVKFTPPGGRIAVTLKRAGSDLELMVKDNGKGISRNFLPFVFDRFRQADSSITRDHGGLGLGLAIVRHLVELHGGNVYAESEGEGTGATFRLSLPISATALTGGPTASALTGEFARANGSATLSGIHVLVVDDERDTVEMVEAVLCRDGARVTTAGSVKEALESIAQSKPDIIVSDIGMPGQDGYELIRQVRAVEQGSTGGIPAIALTAYVRSDEREMAMLAGYQEHLAKPVDPDVLIAAIAGLTNS
jgi:CheY-like chemotaxis protein/two-component sensor histidine kinase